MFREFKEYQDILSLYQKVYQSNEDIIKEAFASEEFTEEEAIFLEQNFDAIIEQIITEEEILTEQPRVKNPTPKAKTTSVPSSTIQGKAGGVMGKVKSALGKVGSKIKDVAKTAVKTGTAPLKSGQGAGKMVGKGAKLLSKMGPAGKAAAVATLAGGAIAAGLAARNKNAASKQVDKYVADRKGSKPIRKIDPAPFNKQEKSSTAGQAAAAGAQKPLAADSKAATASKPVAKMGRIEKKNRERLGDARVDALKKKNAEFQAAKKSGNLAQYRKDNPKLSGKERAQQMAKDRIAKKKAAAAGTAEPKQVQTKPAPTPSGDKLKAGSFGISQKGKEQAAMNKGEAAAKKTNIPSGDKLKAGSFGISKKGKDQAAANKAEVAKKKESNTVPSGSFGISAKGKEQAAKNKAEVADKKTSGNTSAMNVSATKKMSPLMQKRLAATKVGENAAKEVSKIKPKPGQTVTTKTNNDGSVTSKVTQGTGGGTEGLTKSAGSLEKNKLKAEKLKREAAKRNAMEKEFEIPESKQYDAYDLVLEYLLSSEQVATIEEANYVMTEMDAETIQSIVEEQKKNFNEGLAGMAVKTGLAIAGGVLAKKGLDKAKKGFDNFLNNQRGKGFGGNKRVDDTRKGSGDNKVGEKIYYGK